MPDVIFVLIVDWVIRHTNNRKRGLRWKFTSVLEDLDYADDVALISSRFADLQEKTDSRGCWAQDQPAQNEDA